MSLKLFIFPDRLCYFTRGRSSEEAAVEGRIPEEGARASPRVNRRGRESGKSKDDIKVIILCNYLSV